MRRERFVISDQSWALIEPLLPGTTRDRGVTARDNRLFLEAVLWRVRVGGPWRDLPAGFGDPEQRLQAFSTLGTTRGFSPHFRGFVR